MDILFKNLKSGSLKLRAENLDDLWYLSGVIREGDLVKSVTERRIKGKGDRLDKSSERVTVNVRLKVEKVDFNPEQDTLRISGNIIEGPEDLIAMGSHHTFNVREGTVITITKDRWPQTDLDRIYEAKKSTLRPKILVAVIDEGEANLALLRESKIVHYDLSKAIGGKYDTKGRKERKLEFYSDLSDFISNIHSKENVSAIILTGPGFEKENFCNFLSEKHPELAKKSCVESTGSSGRAAINEVVKKPIAKKIADEINSAVDIRLVDDLLTKIGKDEGLAAYSLKDVEKAASMGAAETLLICDDFFQKNRGKVEALIQTAKKINAKVHLVNHEAEAGQQLTSLGGIAATLRFRIQ